MNEAVAGIVEDAKDLDAVVDEGDEDGDAEGGEGEGVVGANEAQENLLQERGENVLRRRFTEFFGVVYLKSL